MPRPRSISRSSGRPSAACWTTRPSPATSSSRGRAEDGGPRRLRQDLRALSVPEPFIEAALQAQWPEPEAALDLAEGLATRRARQLGAIPRDVKRRRLLGFLARRGFSGSRVAELVRRILNQEQPVG
ncbi:MAG: RecX family transcriptional regulator [Gemmatimonadales bacterium]